MILAPGSFARTDSAKRAVAKSPGTNSPLSSTKKQRSASPSNATPKSAFSSSVFRMMNSRFSGSSGFGSWFGKLPSGSKKHVTASTGRRSSTGGSMAPAIPFAASMTTRSGLIASTSTNESTRSTNAGQMSASLTCPWTGTLSYGLPSVSRASARSRTSSSPSRRRRAVRRAGRSSSRCTPWGCARR